MRVLAFDACLGAVSVAAGTLDASGAWSAHASAHAPCVAGHAEQLMPMLSGVMHKAGFAFRDLDRVAVTVGPGGFTGVRVGVAAARALALATGCALVGVTSLEALAAEARLRLGDQGLAQALVVAVDARRGMVFFARCSPGDAAVSPPQLLTLDAAAEQVGSEAALIVGSAAELVAARVQAAGGVAHAGLVDLQPDASSIAQLGAARPPVQMLQPLYLRPPDAKAQTSMTLPRAQP